MPRRKRSAWEKERINELSESGMLFLGNPDDEAFILWLAITDEQPIEVKRLLNHVSVEDCEEPTAEDCNLLHVAAKRGNTTIIQLLLDAGVNPDLPGEHGVALRYAAIEGNTDAYRLLKKVTSPRFHTGIDKILEDQRIEFPDRELNRKLCRASLEGRMSTIERLLGKGIGPNVRSYAFEGNTPLHLAVRGGEESTVKLLLDAGALVDGRNYVNMTPLFFAHNTKTCRLLLDNGATPNLVDHDGINAIMRAYSPQVFSRLEQAGVDFTCLDSYGNSAMFHMLDHLRANKRNMYPKNVKVDATCDKGLAKTIRKLLKNNLSPNNVDPKFGTTPLMIACSLNLVETATALIRAGADTAAEDNNGRRAVDWTQKRTPIRKLLA